MAFLVDLLCRKNYNNKKRTEDKAMKKIIILIGNYGSGKTEIAMNLAVRAAAGGGGARGTGFCNSRR